MRTTWPVVRRLTFEWNALAALPLLLVAALAAAFARPGNPATVISTVEIAAPLAGLISFAHLLAVDIEERTLELRFSYPPKRWRLVLERIVPALAALGAVIVVAVLLAQPLVPSLSVVSVLIVAGPPSLALLGLAGFVAAITGSRLIAALPGLLWWAISYFTGPPGFPGVLGALQTLTHLYQFSRPLLRVSFACNRCLLSVLGLLFLTAAAMVFERRAR